MLGKHLVWSTGGSCSHYPPPCSRSLIGARHHGCVLTLRDTNLDPHSGDRSLASKSAAAFAASNVSAVPSATRSLRLPLLELALRRTSHVGTPCCVNTSNVKSLTSVQTAGSGHMGEGSGCHSMSDIYLPSVEGLLRVQHPLLREGGDGSEQGARSVTLSRGSPVSTVGRYHPFGRLQAAGRLPVFRAGLGARAEREYSRSVALRGPPRAARTATGTAELFSRGAVPFLPRCTRCTGYP